MKVVEKLRKNRLLVIIAFVYLTLMVFMPEKGISAFKNSLYYFKEMLEILPAVFILIALIDTWVSRKAIMNQLGDNSGMKGGVFAFLLGSLSAGPLYAAFPICKVLLKKGASVVNICILLCAWAVVKVPMLINEVKFLGFKFMVVRWILTVISIVIIAYIVKALVKKEDMPSLESNEELVTLVEKYCVGCGMCSRILPEKFETSNGKAHLMEKEFTNEELEILENFLEKCPGNAISVKEKVVEKV